MGGRAGCSAAARLPSQQFPSVSALLPHPSPLPLGAWRGAALSVSCGHSPHADFAKGEEIHPREAICLWKMERSREKRLETALI